MRCNVRDVTFLHIIAMFIRRDTVRWAAAYNGVNVIQSHHLPNGMLFAFAGVLFNHNQEWIFSLSLLCVLISEMICSHAAARHCATGNFCAWRVPPHNDERKPNLISTFIYRTYCSNGVITISSPRCHLPLSHSHPCPPSLPPCLFWPYSFLKECIWNHANGNKWTNECFMNAFMMRKCKWGWVNEWMFNERLLNEKDLLSRALT